MADHMIVHQHYGTGSWNSHTMATTNVKAMMDPLINFNNHQATPAVL